jgi:hypothetical protein
VAEHRPPARAQDPRDFGQQPLRVGKTLQGVVGDRDIGRCVPEGQRPGQVGEHHRRAGDDTAHRCERVGVEVHADQPGGGGGEGQQLEGRAAAAAQID